MKKQFKQKNQSKLILAAIFLLAVAIRMWFVSGNNVLFWFDQARDAVEARSIIENRDLKIQGPSASGTDNSIFHGVLYYYLIAPLYFFGGGSPEVVAGGLAILSSLGVVVVYFLAKEIFQKEKIALWSAFFVAISAISVQAGTWLSNPVIMNLSMPLFFYLVWKVFFAGQKKYLFWLAFFLGVNNQAAIFTVFLFGVLAVVYFYQMNQEKKLMLFSIKQLVGAGAIYLLTIFTMLLTEALMFKRGILTFDIFNKTNEHFIKGTEAIWEIINFYLNFFLRTLNPLNILLFFIPLFGLVVLAFWQLKTSKKFYFLVALLSPLWLLTWHFRTSLYVFIGLEVFVYILLAVGLMKVEKLFLGKLLVVVIAGGLLTTNVLALDKGRSESRHLFGLQQGVLAEQIAVVEKTYELAGGKEFSISSLTAPYGVNVTWGYLYHQYGLKKYSFVPNFFGPSQAGWVGESFLPEVKATQANHFTIIEADIKTGEKIYQQFLLDQTVFSSTPSAVYQFGNLTLQHRKTIN